jgi:hypothetical protein
VARIGENVQHFAMLLCRFRIAQRWIDSGSVAVNDDHIFNWSFEDVEREVKGSLLYRQLARVGAGTAPDRKTLGRQALP